MKRNLIRYQTRPEAADENQRLIEQVFRELRTEAPEGLRYLALRLEDGSFVHFVSVTEEGDGKLPGLPAFKAFQNGIRDRVVEPPKVAAATVIGDYRMLGD